MRTPPTMNRADYLQMHRERRELVISEVKAGRRYVDIAAQFGISSARVSQIAATAGINRGHGAEMRRARKAKAGVPQP